MVIFKKTNFTIFIMILSFVLLILIYNWMGFLTDNKYIVECLTNNGYNSPSITQYSHTVDLPLTTTYSCKNFCGPTSRCSVTGQQCLSDIDCPGCQPYVPPLRSEDKNCPYAEDDAGKLTFTTTPQYSSLTSGFGTKNAIVSKNVFSKPSQANFGTDVWTAPYKQSLALFDKRYKQPTTQYMTKYPSTYSLTGDFMEEGPLAANAYFRNP